MNSWNDVQKQIDDLMLSNLVLKADIQGLLDTLAALAQKAGVTEIDGVDIGTIFA